MCIDPLESWINTVHVLPVNRGWVNAGKSWTSFGVELNRATGVKLTRDMTRKHCNGWERDVANRHRYLLLDLNGSDGIVKLSPFHLIRSVVGLSLVLLFCRLSCLDSFRFSFCFAYFCLYAYFRISVCVFGGWLVGLVWFVVVVFLLEQFVLHLDWASVAIRFNYCTFVLCLILLYLIMYPLYWNKSLHNRSVRYRFLF